MLNVSRRVSAVSTIDWPSGEKEGHRAPSVPGMRRGASSLASERTYRAVVPANAPVYARVDPSGDRAIDVPTTLRGRELSGIETSSQKVFALFVSGRDE